MSGYEMPELPPYLARMPDDGTPLPDVRPCWVLTPERHPGLLSEWRKIGDRWEGRVAHLIWKHGGWMFAEEWVGAEGLEAG